MMNELKKIVETDILECKKYIDGNSAAEADEFMDRLTAKYYGIIDNFGVGLCANFDEDYELNMQSIRHNLTLLKEKMEMFVAMGCKNIFGKDNKPNVQINNHNSNSNVIDINVSFEQVRESIENMTALTNSEVEEILSKIDEIEKIVQSEDRKTKKWENAKGIIKWIADKGVDVGITLLPLLLEIK